MSNSHSDSLFSCAKSDSCISASEPLWIHCRIFELLLGLVTVHTCNTHICVWTFSSVTAALCIVLFTVFLIYSICGQKKVITQRTTFIPQSVSRTVSSHYEAGCKFNIDPGGAPACDAVGQEMWRVVGGWGVIGWPFGWGEESATLL